MVTVVIPVYNVERWLDRCVSSVVNQTYRNLEIILVDDESPDKCPKMCDEWAQKDSRVKVIHKKMRDWVWREIQELSMLLVNTYVLWIAMTT